MLHAAERTRVAKVINLGPYIINYRYGFWCHKRLSLKIVINGKGAW